VARDSITAVIQTCTDEVQELVDAN
jgi:hypothetical protein